MLIITLFYLIQYSYNVPHLRTHFHCHFPPLFLQFLESVKCLHFQFILPTLIFFLYTSHVAQDIFPAILLADYFHHIGRLCSNIYFVSSMVMAGGNCYVKCQSEWKKNPKVNCFSGYDCFPRLFSSKWECPCRYVNPKGRQTGLLGFSQWLGDWHLLMCFIIDISFPGFWFQPFVPFLEKWGKIHLYTDLKVRFWLSFFVKAMSYLPVGFIHSSSKCLLPTYSVPGTLVVTRH